MKIQKPQNSLDAKHKKKAKNVLVWQVVNYMSNHSIKSHRYDSFQSKLKSF
jgi:hypothetical protein